MRLPEETEDADFGGVDLAVAEVAGAQLDLAGAVQLARALGAAVSP
ncbi:MAG TPA: hypothetical protein VFI10_00810 [Gaiellaceae bacterium]|nr:hypothetical protein [Gaiellaceae bacterium]